MAKMENRVNFLENQLSGCLENLDAFSVQLTVIQDFLQKQFGSRFVDYAINRGVFIEKPAPMPNRSTSNSYYMTSKSASSSSTMATNSQNYDVSTGDEFAYVEALEPSDPLAFVEIIDDSEDRHQVGQYDEGMEGDNEDYPGINGEDVNNGNEEYYEDDENQGYEDNGFGETSDYDASGLVIVNCVSEKGKKELPPIIRLPSPPPITARPPPTRTYVKSSAATVTEPQKQRLPSNFLGGRKRPAASTSSDASNSSPLPKMPLLHPQVTQAQASIKEEYDDLLDFSSLTDTGDSTLDGMHTLDMKLERVDPECNEDLRDYYDVLPDKSVQCKICDKVLKAGWHKYGRHYRTHTGEKPFSCHICGENFARKDNMNNHIKSKHEHKRERPSSNENVTSTDELLPMYFLSPELC